MHAPPNNADDDIVQPVARRETGLSPYAVNAMWMRLYIYIYIYLGEELDAVADPDQVHVVVEPEDVHPGPRAAGVEDHGVPPRPTRRIDTTLRSRLVVVAVAVAVAHGEEEARRLPTEHGGVGKDRHAEVRRRGPPRQLQGQQEHCCCHRPRCHCYVRTLVEAATATAEAAAAGNARTYGVPVTSSSYPYYRRLHALSA
jgi:hypothetical protein